MNYIDENAMKETLFGKGNRKAASPTESAAGGNRYRERSGAGCLNGEAEASALGQHVTRVKCKSGMAGYAFDGRRGCSKRVVPRIVDNSPRNTFLYSGAFFIK